MADKILLTAGWTSPRNIMAIIKSIKKELD